MSTPRRLMSMRKALEHRDVFARVLAGDSWSGWRTLLIAAAGEELTTAERVIFTQLTGRAREPGEPIDEFWCIAGRRSGKSRAIAVLGTYLACLIDWTPHLAPGERGALPIMSASTYQAAKIREYALGAIENAPALAEMLEGVTNDTLTLRNRIDIIIRAANFRTIRSGTYIGAIIDEVAFLRSENSANPDTEVLAAIRPGLATTGGMLAAISSPYAQRGELWTTFKRDFGPDGDPAILVARAASKTLNPTLPDRVIAKALERDPASAAAEYLAQFRSDVETFVAREVVEAAVTPGRFELPPVNGVKYFGFVDPSGGSSDSMTLGIAHAENGLSVLDAIRERKPPFSPEAVVQEFAELLKAYAVRRVIGDRYAGEWSRERFRVAGIEYVTSDKPKSDLYRDLLPLLNSGKVELLDNPRLASQLCGLERRTSRGGKDSIDHAPGAHDDLANSAAGALLLTLAPARTVKISQHALAFARSRGPLHPAF